jgi:hypothetical protein
LEEELEMEDIMSLKDGLTQQEVIIITLLSVEIKKIYCNKRFFTLLSINLPYTDEDDTSPNKVAR